MVKDRFSEQYIKPRDSLVMSLDFVNRAAIDESSISETAHFLALYPR
jgi:hypothetical protein